jgi:uncharacterized protein
VLIRAKDMDKLQKLKSLLKKMNSVLVAYSGGVDSTFLLKVAKDTLGDNLLAVTADSPTYTKRELGFAKKMTKEFGIRHKVIKTYELKDKNFISNPINRCYYCKLELFSRLKGIAKKNNLNFVIDASNCSDKLDFRPGSFAKENLGVRSPLQEAGLTKEDIRKFSKRLGLISWDMPGGACLASRIPYGSKISLSVLSKVNQAEIFLRKLGFKFIRVRHYNGLCRIEVSKDGIPLLINKRKRVVSKFKKIGYDYITLDLEGYRSGNMNTPYLRMGNRYYRRKPVE